MTQRQNDLNTKCLKDNMIQRQNDFRQNDSRQNNSRQNDSRQNDSRQNDFIINV